MKKVIIDGHEYTAETAVGLIQQIKMLHWHAGEGTSPEEYIALQEESYQKVTGRKMALPDADTETRADRMFQAVAQCGAWIYQEGGQENENE